MHDISAFHLHDDLVSHVLMKAQSPTTLAAWHADCHARQVMND